MEGDALRLSRPCLFSKLKSPLATGTPAGGAVKGTPPLSRAALATVVDRVMTDNFYAQGAGTGS